jgi:hypothetical protein
VTASSSPAPKRTPRPGKPPAGSSETTPPDPDEKPSLAKKPVEPDTTPGPPPARTPPPAATPAPPVARTPAASAPSTSDNAPTRGGRHAAEPSVGQLVSDASTHLSNLLHSEIELAKLELRSTVKNAGTGIGLFLGAAVVLVFSLTFGFFALAEGLAEAGLDRWLAFLVVFGMQLVLVALFVYVGVKKVKRIKAPARTIKTTRETVDYLKKSRG